jgi:hypothetical protein
MSAVVKVSSGDIIETVMVKGDLAKLTADERNAYYVRMCEAVGVNPVTRPFEYITLNGRMVLYARKDCTDQLRKKNGISVTDLTESEREGVYIVTAKVTDHEGRTDIAKGAVNIANLKGEALANAIMKAETKSKRRATLSICGLGMLDETEVEDIVANQPQTARERIANVAFSPDPEAAGEAMHQEWAGREGANLAKAIAAPAGNEKRVPHAVPTLPEGDTAIKWAQRYVKAIGLCSDVSEFAQWISLNKENIDRCMTVARARAYIEPAHTAVRRQIKEAMPEDRPTAAPPATSAPPPAAGKMPYEAGPDLSPPNIDCWGPGSAWDHRRSPTSAAAAETAAPASPAPASASTSASPASTALSKPAGDESVRPTSAPAPNAAPTSTNSSTVANSASNAVTFGDSPEAFVKDALLRLDQAETIEALVDVWDRDIAAFELNLLPAHMDRLYQRYRHCREEMKP